jgi:hypothetical protein
MRPRTVRCGALSIGVLVLGWGCNPLAPSDVLGDWQGFDRPNRFTSFEIRFTPERSGIEGRACYVDGPYLTFTDAPVSLNGRRVTVRATVNGITRIFEGEFDSDDKKIIGAWTNTPSNEVTLTRGGSYCTDPSGLRPPPPPL